MVSTTEAESSELSALKHVDRKTLQNKIFDMFSFLCPELPASDHKTQDTQAVFALTSMHGSLEMVTLGWRISAELVEHLELTNWPFDCQPLHIKLIWRQPAAKFQFRPLQIWKTNGQLCGDRNYFVSL